MKISDRQACDIDVHKKKVHRISKSRTFIKKMFSHTPVAYVYDLSQDYVFNKSIHNPMT